MSAPAPAASRPPSPRDRVDTKSASMAPGTASPPSGMATRFASTPIGATVPNASAVMGAVTSVAATAGSTRMRFVTTSKGV